MSQRSPESCRTHFNKFYFDGIFARKLGLSNESYYIRKEIPYIFKQNRLEHRGGGDNNYVAQSLSGYSFARSEFNIPYDHSAESILNSVNQEDNSFDEKKSNIVQELYCALFLAYNHRLKERARRYRVIQNHGLILQRKTLAWLSRYSEVFQDQFDITRLTAFVQISDPLSFDFLLESIKLFSDKKRFLNR